MEPERSSRTGAPRRTRALLRLLRADAARWGVLGGLIALSQFGALAGPLVVREVVDEAVGGTTTAKVAVLGGLFLTVAVATQVLGVLVAKVATTTAWRVSNTVRRDLTRHVLGLDHEFHRRHTPGELIQRVDGDVTNVSDFLSNVLPRLVGAAVLLGGMLTVLSVVDARLGIGMVVYLAAATTLLLLIRHRAVRESSDEMSAYAKLYGGIEERLTAAEDLRANGAEVHAMWRFVEESGDVLQSSVKREKAFLKMWWTLQAAVTGGVVGSLALSAGLVGRGTITLGTAFLLFQYVHLMSRPLEDVIHQMETVQKASGAMRRVIELQAMRPAIVDRGTVSPPPGPLSVEAAAVGLTYDGDDEPTLVDVDLAIAPGRSVGIVGRTGSGKTTFSRLLLRLIEATGGTLRLGGVEIADIPMAELRRRVALVPQEVELFAGSVRDNVTMFDPEPSDAEVVRALREVGLDDLVTGGIDRPLGAAGAGLSAGQAQLLALARVWLRRPDLVVLDEATARVDPATEERIGAAVARLMKGRTTFVIAHRLSTLDGVDEIAVFDAGRIIEHGDRAALSGRDGGRFRRLLELALALDVDGDDEGAVDGGGAPGRSRAAATGAGARAHQ